MPVEDITLQDSASGAEAHILVGYGFNCHVFRVPCGEQTIDVLWSEAGFQTGEKRASGSGIPLLFPYPGRIRGKSLSWEGKQYPLEGDDGRGNAIHGFVIARPWRLLEQSSQRAVGQFQASVDDPTLLDRWPADFRITATYEVSGMSLRTDYLIENPSERPLPCGFGTHPYFRVPLGGASADDCRIQMPFGSTWEMVDMLPTGKSSGWQSPATGMAFGEASFDTVFGKLVFHDGWCASRVTDSHSGRSLVIEFSEAFRECVVYNPPHREAICVEPYTCVPNAAELTAAGVDAGLRVLQPGESFQARVVMSVE